jgi:uncharacterized protein YbjT (DUF2867 family)
VLGLARNDAAADVLTRMGAEVHRGDLSDPESLSAGARVCEGAIHTAYNHDFSQFVAAGETDRCAVEALGAALAGTGRPLLPMPLSSIAPDHLSAPRARLWRRASKPVQSGRVRICIEPFTISGMISALR